MTKAERDRQARKNRQRLLEAEAAALLLLLRRRKKAVLPFVGSRSVAWIAERLEREVMEGILDLRLTSRHAGIARLKDEAFGLGIVGKSHNSKGAQNSSTLDLRRAREASRAHSKRWLRLAEASDPRRALEESKGSIRRIAVTESSEAFNSGRTHWARENLDGEWGRQWDAMLDACPVCRRQDGVIVRLHEPFPLGEPGTVHNHCRCSWALVVIG
jgi:hypothetical protein